MSTKAYNMSTGKEIFYSCSPRMATICAYAQDRGDFSTWMYEERYGNLVEIGRYFYFCGDWAANKRFSNDEEITDKERAMLEVER